MDGLEQLDIKVYTTQQMLLTSIQTTHRMVLGG
jgi:hypothetical protein